MKELICIVCPSGCHITVGDDGTVTGNTRKRGEAYARKEATHPTRVLTTTVRLESAVLRRLPVKTREDIPKEKLFDAMRALDGVTVRAPVRRGDVVLRDVCATGVDVIACRDVNA